MSSDDQFTALGPAAVGFQTDGANIDVGADIAGHSAGIRGRADDGPGVAGAGGYTGVVGTGWLRGVHGRGSSRYVGADSTTGVLAEGYGGATGLTGLAFSSAARGQLGPVAGVIGVSNAQSAEDPNDPTRKRGASVVGLSRRTIGQLIDTPEPLPLPNPNDPADGEGTAVWGASGSGTGVHGQSQTGRGGVFESAGIAQLRLVPHYDPDNPVIPTSGSFGDLYVVVYGDMSSTATTGMYLCVAPGDGTPGNFAAWAPFLFGPPIVAGP